MNCGAVRACRRPPWNGWRRRTHSRIWGWSRRAALWAIRGLPDEALPLFAAADAGRAPRPEIIEPPVPIVPMPAGRNVVEDYSSVGLTLRQHPVAFLRGELHPRGIIPCADLLTSRDGQRLTVAGLVLVRQRPGTATGVIFITSRTRPASPTLSSGRACSTGSAALSSQPACWGVVAACSGKATSFTWWRSNLRT